MRIDCIRAKNLDVFWTVATTPLHDAGHGAIAVSRAAL